MPDFSRNVSTVIVNEDSMTFPDVLALYHQARYTGPMLLQWAQGHVLVVEIPPKEPEARIRVARKSVDRTAKRA